MFAVFFLVSPVFSGTPCTPANSFNIDIIVYFSTSRISLLLFLVFTALLKCILRLKAYLSRRWILFLAKVYIGFPTKSYLN